MIHLHPRPFGELLRQHRLLAGLTQAALAERARLSPDTISALERGVNQTPQPATLDLLVQALQLSAAAQAEFRAAARWEQLEPRPTPAPLAARHQLPTPPTPLFGRAEAVQTVCALLARPEVRQLTLTGTAGVGKTRLALAVAAEVEAAFPDGVIFIPLAALADPALVVPTIAEALFLRDTGTLPLLILLASALGEQQALLVLDNFEQVIGAAPSLAALLEACPAVKLLVTSREVLHLRAEHQVVVPPLPLPTLPPGKVRGPLDPAALAENPALQLMLYHIRAAQPDFQVTPGTIVTLARICQHLEGIPLALELAAPRLKLLSPHALLARLEGRLQVLTGGARDLPERQRTMRATMAWSYDLLAPAEQALLRRLAVCVGGWRLSAAEPVCQAAGALELDLLEGLASLLDKSLLYQEPGRAGEPRFGMLSVLREFGLEQLEVAGERAATRAAHAAYFLALAQEAEPQLLGADQNVWLDRLEADHDNLRAALGWAFEQAGQTGTVGSAAEARAGWELVGRVTDAFYWFWLLQGHHQELQRFLRQLLEAPPDVAGDVRAKLLLYASGAAFAAGDPARGTALLEESIRLYRSLAEQSSAEPELQRGLIAALTSAGHLALNTGEYPALERLCEECLALSRQVGERWREAEVLHLLALGSARRGEEARGRALCEAALAICRELGEGGGTSIQLLSLGCFAWRQGDLAGAQQEVEESLAVSQQSATPVMIGPCLVWLGIILVARGQPTGAARLWGAADRVGEAAGMTGQQLFDLPIIGELDPAARAYYAQAESTARAHLGEAAFAAAWAEGRALTPEQAVAKAAAEAPARLPDGPAT